MIGNLVTDDPQERGSFADPGDLDLFLETLGKFERGEISPEAWRAFRLLHGTYGQRQEGDVHMLRVKIPQGVLGAHQLRALADVAESSSRGFGHITTRQNFQLHFVRLGDVELALRRLASAGLTTREACGNSVRNVTACPFAGVAPGETFDVSPYAEALTRHFLRHPLSASLPRKFKVAFEGCTEDHAALAIHDLGFHALARGDDGKRGFRVVAGGGTAALPTPASVLFEFLPAASLLEAAEAVIRVFHRLGERQNRHAARMKYLVRKIGFEAFRAEVHRAMEEIGRGGVRLPFDPEDPPAEGPPTATRPPPPPPVELAAQVARGAARGPGLVPAPLPVLGPPPGDAAAWLRTNVRPQRRPGWSAAVVTVRLGDLTAGQLRGLADLALSFGDGTARVTREQDVVLRWVRDEDLVALHEALAALGLGDAGAGTIADVTTCPGAESCRLAVTQSRGLGKLLSDHLRARPELAALAPDLLVKVSGCPNGCGQHHIAAIGFQGSVRKVAGRAVPQYFVMVGGASAAGGVRVARGAAKIPARRVPQALELLLRLYEAERRPGEDASAFFGRLEPARAKAALAGLERLTAEAAQADDFVDLGESAPFLPVTQEGECAA
jgi:sulfite reductase beta subunit-like hemoprotein